LPGTIGRNPETGDYGGWKVSPGHSTGYFRTENRDGRWWLIDPEGYPFIHRGVAVFRPGRSPLQQSSLDIKYGSRGQWVVQEANLLRQYGMNGVGAWSDHQLIRDHQVPL